jgi:Zn-dependent protease with chaperone function
MKEGYGGEFRHMPFLLLLVVTFTSLPGKWPAPPDWLGPAGSALLTLLGIVLLVSLAGLMSRRLSRDLVSHSNNRSLLVRRYAARRFYLSCFLLLFYLGALYFLGWGATVRSLIFFGVSGPPGIELLLLAPLVGALLGCWALFYPVDRAIHLTGKAEALPFPGRFSYVLVQAQHNLILAVPLLLLMIVQQLVLRSLPGLDEEVFAPLLSLGLLFLFFPMLPWVLRLLLRLKPLAAGPLRDRLLAAARRLHFRCNDIWLWKTGNGIANAMVTGISPWLRYIVVTDRLVTDLTPDEVEAVFGHEVGHIKHHHPLYYLVFLLASMGALIGVLLATGLVTAEESSSAAQDVAAQLPLLLILIGYVFVVFGFLSRRCERQADIYGCRAVSCAAASCSGHDGSTVLAPRARGLCATGIQHFISALEKVARVNGISRDKPGWLSSWLHSTIALRVEFLQRMCSDPHVEPRFQRRLVLVKWGLLLGLGAVFLTVILVVGPGKLLGSFG